jgi:DNA-binding NtrC family response regulator
MNRVLVVDDEPGMRAALEAHFLRREWHVDTAASAGEALEKFRRLQHALVVTDIRMPGDDGFAVMREARALSPHTAVILLTAYGNVPEAVTAIQGGACDYLIKPVSFEQLERVAQRILAQADAHAEASEGLAGKAPVWLRALDRARQAAASGADVLIEAESGTGKELIARMIHRLSPRRDHAFVAVNCSAFPETLLESELFGHTRGAFTGAMAAKPGRFELAHKGTLLLDEVGEMPLGLQPKLLRVLQEREFERLGDTRSTRVDVRVIATTNRSLAEMVREGKFRADLYYRLHVIPLALPPLRERAGDVRQLAEYFLRMYAPAGKNLRLGSDFLARLEAHSWPGNVRELANCVRRAVALSGGLEIDVDFEEIQIPHPFDRVRPSAAAQNAASIGQPVESPLATSDPAVSEDFLRPGVSLETAERRLLEMTLAATKGNRSRAAGLLGVSLRTVRNKIRSYGLPSWSSYVHD